VITAKYAKTPMGTGKEAIEKFHQKDEEALHIIVSDGKKSIHTLFSNLDNPYDYFRYAGSDKIYQLKAKVTNNYNTDLSNWRSPHIVSHKEEELLKIEVTHPKINIPLPEMVFNGLFRMPTMNLKSIRQTEQC